MCLEKDNMEEMSQMEKMKDEETVRIGEKLWKIKRLVQSEDEEDDVSQEVSDIYPEDHVIQKISQIAVKKNGHVREEEFKGIECLEDKEVSDKEILFNTKIFQLMQRNPEMQGRKFNFRKLMPIKSCQGASG